MEYYHSDHEDTLHLDTPTTDLSPRLLCHLLHRCVCAYTDVHVHSHSFPLLSVTNLRRLKPKHISAIFSQGACPGLTTAQET